MCGIVGYVGPKQCVPILVEGLRRLEYRGYDSAGLALHTGERGIQIVRAVGKLANLEAALQKLAAFGDHGHRSHALGDARAPQRGQRPPARRGQRGGRPQRHHREPRRAAARARGKGRALLQRHRHRDRRAPHRSRAPGRGRAARRRRASVAASGARGLRHRRAQRDRAGRDRRRKGRQPRSSSAWARARCCAPATSPRSSRIRATWSSSTTARSRCSRRTGRRSRPSTARRSPARSSASTGQPPRPKRAATSTSCSRRSTSSRARSRTRCAAVWISAAGDVIPEEIGVTPELAKSLQRVYFVACGTSCARGHGRTLLDRAARARAGGRRDRQRGALPRARSSVRTIWSSP